MIVAMKGKLMHTCRAALAAAVLALLCTGAGAQNQQQAAEEARRAAEGLKIDPQKEVLKGAVQDLSKDAAKKAAEELVKAGVQAGLEAVAKQKGKDDLSDAVTDTELAAGVAGSSTKTADIGTQTLLSSIKGRLDDFKRADLQQKTEMLAQTARMVENSLYSSNYMESLYNGFSFITGYDGYFELYQAFRELISGAETLYRYSNELFAADMISVGTWTYNLSYVMSVTKREIQNLKALINLLRQKITAADAKQAVEEHLKWLRQASQQIRERFDATRRQAIADQSDPLRSNVMSQTFSGARRTYREDNTPSGVSSVVSVTPPSRQEFLSELKSSGDADTARMGQDVENVSRSIAGTASPLVRLVSLIIGLMSVLYLVYNLVGYLKADMGSKDALMRVLIGVLFSAIALTVLASTFVS